jgi:hypothetical protein
VPDKHDVDKISSLVINTSLEEEEEEEEEESE